MKNRVRKIAAKKFHATRLRFRQIRAGQYRFRHVRVSQVGFPKICSGQIRAGELGLAKIRAFEIRAPQNRSAKINGLKIGVRKIRAGQIRSGSAFFPAEKACVRFQNVGQLLAVVLNTLCFSQSHDLSDSPSNDSYFTRFVAP
jgi:hypothetical protein